MMEKYFFIIVIISHEGFALYIRINLNNINLKLFNRIYHHFLESLILLLINKLLNKSKSFYRTLDLSKIVVQGSITTMINI